MIGEYFPAKADKWEIP